MKNHLKAITALLFCCIAILSCKDETSGDYAKAVSTADTSLSKEKSIERGEYLSRVIGCDHCHTPKKMTPQGPVPDMDKWMMGFPADATLPEIVPEAVGPGKWILMHGDLTAAVGPWGVSFGANLTPADTGIGSWSFEQFKTAMTKGKYKGMENSRPLMPPMPWQSYKEMPEEDLKAIYNYLMSLEPIENVVPSYIPPDRLEQ
ncbi:c-type cytochrome [Altibacter sp. HG106]|uniref:c-type cytochrome n=1 Tax=Altibacter sp. HG106 TaxID=3023937 RepID=UPI00235086B5|nr:c-type cytochrome [Altibacter sp. HG106]MDC7994727.1 diheme cytochrome c-553 [Altibacter sp. HG106]